MANQITSHWEVEGPLGTTAKWDAEMTRLDENKRIAWNSKDHEGNYNRVWS